MLTIAGAGAAVTIDAGGNSRVFQVDDGVTASLSGLTITGGLTSGNGGGLENFGTLTLTGCTVTANSGRLGGGMYNDGTATLIDCTISGNSSQFGGGVYNNGTATLTALLRLHNGNSGYDSCGGRWRFYGTSNSPRTRSGAPERPELHRAANHRRHDRRS